MHKYASILRKVQLFNDISDAELDSILACLGVKIIRKKRNEFILIEGNKPEYIGIILEGSAHVVKEDIDGGRIVVAALTAGDLFAEALCCAEVPESPVSVVTNADSTIMMIKFSKILHTCSKACSYHNRLIANMLAIIAQKNLMLQSRLDFVGKKTLRMKILSYLESFAVKQGRNNITIPFNREELADFLCADRSALSHELARMKKDGLLDYHKNHFRLLLKE